MPPKAKFTKQEIIQAAVEITRREGLSAVTTRSIAKELESSARPIFTVFDNMEELKQDIVLAVKDYFIGYIVKGERFEDIGIQFVRFAREEPRFFRLLFLYEQVDKSALISGETLFRDFFKQGTEIIQKEFQLSSERASRLFFDLRVYCLGMATMCANGTWNPSEEELHQFLSDLGEKLLK